jgi:hypothetical protein
MFSHIVVGSNDIARSKKFYDALFTAIGAQPGTDVREGRIAYSHNGTRFIVTKPNDGKPATSANGGTIGFTRQPPGTRPVSPMAAPRSRTRRACVPMAPISPIFEIPTETSWSRLLVPQAELYHQTGGAVLSGAALAVFSCW